MILWLGCCWLGLGLLTWVLFAGVLLDLFGVATWWAFWVRFLCYYCWLMLFIGL